MDTNIILIIAAIIGLGAAIYIIKQFFLPKNPNLPGTGSGGRNPGGGQQQER